MKHSVIFLFTLSLLCCTPKGPQTYNSPFIGKTKNDLIAAKGMAKEIKVFDTVEAYIYKTKEAYFGKRTISKTPDSSLIPKRIVEIEHIYYINKKGIIFKYQVWKKKVK